MKIINIMIISLFLLVSIGFAGSYLVDENLNLLGNDVYNATNINATYIYMNGSLVSTTAANGDITGINTNGDYLNGGCDDGTCNLTLNETELNNSIEEFGYITTYSETDPYWTGNQSFYSTTSDIIAFGYYNSSDFVITDYFTKSDIIGFNYYNSSDFVISDYATNVKVDSIGNFTSWDKDYSDLINTPIALSDFSNDMGFYNSTTLTSNSQLTNGNNYWNDTYATFNKTYADTLYTSNTGTVTSIATTAPISGGIITTTGTISLTACADTEIYKYNSSSGNWECGTDENGGGGGAGMWADGGTYIYPNSTYADNAIIYGYVKAHDWTNVSITESQISDLQNYITDGNTNWDNSYGFITNTVNDLTNYYTKPQINDFNYYNSSDFDINDYYLDNNPYNFYNSSTIPNYILTSDEGNLNVNSSDYWDNINTPNDFTNISVSGNYHINGVILNSSHILDHDGHSVKDTFGHIINRGIVSEITIAKTGGLGINWTAGEIYDEANKVFIKTTAGSGNVTNNAVNYLKWVSGTGLTISTSSSTGNEINIATFSVYDGQVNNYREHSLISNSMSDTRRGLRISFPSRIINGMSVSEDTNATYDLDVMMDAGQLIKDGIEEKNPSVIYSRLTELVRHFHTAGEWDSDTNKQIDTNYYDDGTQLVAIPSNKYVKSYFIYMNGELGWIYPTKYFSNKAQAEASSLSPIPPGLSLTPKLTAVVYQQGDTDFSNAEWQDIRPGISEESFNIVTDHGALAGLSDDDHPQYLLTDGNRELTGNWATGDYNITTTNGYYNGNTLWDNIQNKFITAVDNNYIYMSGTTATLNETKLNDTITDLDTNANTICSGTTTYLDGEGNCDDISNIYINEAGDSTGDLTSDLNIDSNTLVVDYDTNAVGIGTATPQARLHVNYPTTGDVIFQAGTGDGGSDMNIKYGYNGYGWYYKYLGSGSSDNNEWQLWSEGAGSTDMQVFGIKQSGNIQFMKMLSLATGTSVNDIDTTVADNDNAIITSGGVYDGLALQDSCSEITGCVENAITDGNTNWDNSYGFFDDITNFTGTLTDAKWCVYDSVNTEIDCNVEPVTNTDTQDLSYDAGTDVISLTDGGSIDITEVNTDDQTCAEVSGCVQNAITSLVSDTSPQLGGYLDTHGNNIGSTDDEIEKIYIGTDQEVYFGDGQESYIKGNSTQIAIYGVTSNLIIK